MNYTSIGFPGNRATIKTEHRQREQAWDGAGGGGGGKGSWDSKGGREEAMEGRREGNYTEPLLFC